MGWGCLMKALRLLRVSLAASALALPALAAELSHEPLACVPDSGRALLTAEVSGFTPVSVRVDFQVPGASEEYYLEMNATSPARYFAVLPRVSSETREIRYKVSARGEDGRERVAGPFVVFCVVRTAFSASPRLYPRFNSAEITSPAS